MDFNQILLFAGLGLLALIVLFALWGFLGGLKRELKCIAVFIVLLVLFWLVFGDEATLMNAKFGQQVANILDVKAGRNETITTVWDAILAFAKTKIPNGAILLKEGTETYNLLYSVVAAVFRAVGLIAGTVAVLVICPIIRFITHIIWLIYRGIKKSHSKRNVVAKNAQFEADKEVSVEKVVISSNKTSADEAVITKDENELPVKPVTKKRWWGALAGALKGVFVVILVFAPVSGLCAILNTATPKTEAMISNLVSSEGEQKTANSTNVVEMVFDFAEAYNESAVGKFVESSSYFFGKSFSQSLFDKLLRIETKNQVIGLSDELINVVEAVNELNGKYELGSWTNEEVQKALGHLKNSKLLVEAMPVAIEYAHGMETVNSLLSKANQGTKFLELRYIDWDKDLDVILDAVAKAYELNIFPLDEFNYLTMDAEIVEAVVSKLSEANVITKALPIAVKTALKLDAVVNNVGNLDASGIDTIDWKKELSSIANIYEKFQELGIEELKGIDTNALIKELLEDEKQTNTLFELVDMVLELQLLDRLAVPAAINFAAHQEAVKELLDKSGQYNEFIALQNVVTLQDLRILISAARVGRNLVDFTNFPPVVVNVFELDVETVRAVVDKLCTIESLNSIIVVAANVALEIDAVKNQVGDSLDDINFADINWKGDLALLVDIYEAFLEYEFESMDDITAKEWNALVSSILDDSVKFNTTDTILGKLASLDLFTKVGVPAIDYIVEKLISEKANQFAGILQLDELTAEDWKNDFTSLLEIAKAANEIKVLDNLNPFDYKNLDLKSNVAIENFKTIIDKVLSLNILGNDELKNKLLLASIRQFGWLDNDTELDLGNVNWNDEKEVLIELVNVYNKMNGVKAFDIYDIQNIDYQKLLESDEFINYVVEALEDLVDSNLFLEILPYAINKYLLPMIDKLDAIDDETLVRDILDKVNSEELVEEIIKLIDVVRAVIDLGAFKVKDGGISAIDLTNTDAFKTIISGIFDSKLIEGNEGRIIRIILKATNILDIEKGSNVYEELVSLDYSNEKEVLLNFVDAIAPVLKDESFTLIDENGKFNLDLKFWAENEPAQALVQGLKQIFGAYGEEGTGSQLVKALLPVVYDKFVEEKDLIPDDFKEIVKELDFTNANGQTLAHDISCLIYVVEQLVNVNAQSFLDKGSIIINDEFAQAMKNVIDALHEIELIHGHESATLTWGVNYVAQLLKIEIEATDNDFNNVDWQGQKEVYKEIIDDLVILFAKNNIENVNQLKDVFTEILKGKSKYVTDESVNDLLDILDKIADVQVIDAVLPLGIKYVVKLLDEKGLALDYLNNFTSQELAEDFHQIVKIAHIAVDEGELVKYYQNGFSTDMALPKEEVVKTIIHEALQLHILADADGYLLTELYNEYVYKTLSKEKPFFLTAEDFRFETIDWDKEEEIILAVVSTLYDLIELHNMNTIESIMSFFKEKKYTDKSLLTDETGYILVDLLRQLDESQLVENVIVKAYEYGIDFVDGMDKLPFTIASLKGLTKEDLMSLISPLAGMLNIAIEAGALEYVRTNDIAVVNLDLIANIFDKIGDKLGENDNYKDQEVELLTVLLEFAAKKINESLGSNITIEKSDAEAINLQAESYTLAQIIRSCKGVLEANNLVSLNDIINFAKDKKYNSEDFVNNSLVPVILGVLELQAVKLFLPDVFNALIDKVTFVDLSFLKNTFTAEELVSDITQIVNAIDTIKAAELIGLAFGKKVNDLTLHFAEYQELIQVFGGLELLNRKYPELASALINKALSSAKLEQNVTPEMFEGITLAQETPVLVNVLVELEKVCANADLQKVGDLLDITKDAKFYENEKYANKDVVYPLIDALDILTDLQTLEAMMQVVADIAGDYLAKAKVDFSFIVRELTNQELIEDVKLALEYAKDAIEIGLLEYLTTKDIALFDLTKVASMVEGLYDFNIMQKHAAEVMSKALEEINKLVPTLRLEPSMEALEAIDYVHEFAILAQVVTLLDELKTAEVCHSLNDVLDIVKKNLYNQKAFFNENAYDVLIDVLNKVTELETLEVLLPDLIHFAVRTANASRIDISFIMNDIYTTELQIEDIRTLIKMLDKAYDFGLIDYLFDKDIPEINEVVLNEILDEVINLHILDLFFHEFLALGFNEGFDAAKMDIIVSKYEFADVTLEHEIHEIQDVIVQLKAFMEVKGLHSLSDLNEIITRKDYKYEEFYDVTMGEVLANIVSELLDLDSLVVVLPYLLDFAVDKFDKIDLTFLKGNFTKEELRSDIKALVGAIVPAIKAELIGLAFGKKVTELNLHFTEYAEIVDAIKGLSLLNKKYPELASALINKGLVALKTEQSVTPEMFEGITFADEAPSFIAALIKFDEVVKNAGIKTVENLMDVTKQKEFYKNEEYANEDVVYPLIDALNALTNLQTLEAMMQVVANIGVEYADKIGFDARFLFKDLTNEQLISDVKKALELARDAVKLGGLEYLSTKDIANFNPTIVAGMLEGLYDFNILHGNMIEILDIILTFVNSKVKGIEFDINYRELKDVDYYAEFAAIASAILELKPFMEGLEYTSLSSLMNIVKNKDYLYENFYNETSFKALTNAARKLADSKVLGALLPDLLDYVLNLVYNKGYDVVFLKDEIYTNEYKLEDIKTLANILDKAYDFGVVELVFNKELSTINEVIINEILEEVGKLHVLDLFTADLLALGFNKAFEAAKMNITVTRDDFIDVVIANEVKELQDVVTLVKALIDQKGLVSVLDVKDYITAKNYNNKEFFDVETGEILANIARELVDSEIVCALLPKLLDFSIDKLEKFDVSYLKGLLTKEELKSDVLALADAIVPAIQAELVGLAFKEKATDLTLYFDEYKQILSAVQNMNIINKKWPELATTITNEVLKALKVEKTVDGSEYVGLTFAQDVPYLLNALDELNVACQKANVVKVQDIIDIINTKDYLLAKYANEEIVTPLLNALEQIVYMANVEAFLPLAMDYLANMLVEKKIDVAFLFEDLTNSELIEDARLLVAYARDAVKLGALEYLTTKNIANLNVPLAADMVAGLYGFNMIKKHASVAMEKLVDMLNSKVKDIQFNLSKEDFDTVDFENELKVLSEIVALFEDMMKAEVCHSLQDVLDIVNNKLYNNKAFYNELAVDTMLEMIRKATELKTVELALPDLVDYLVRFVDSKGYDLSFIKNDEYTNEFILEDINTLTYIAKKAYEFGVVDYIFDKEILVLNDVLFNEMLEDAINLNILKLYLPDLIALGVNKGLVAAKMDKDITVTRDDFVSVVLADEIHALQDVVTLAKALMNQKGLVSLLDVKDLITTKGYNNKEFFDVATGTILADFVTELTDLETVKVLLPMFYNYALDRVAEIDLAFLKEAVTKDELVSDAKTLAKAIVPAINAELVGLLFKEKATELTLHFDAYKEILTTVQDMYIINNAWPVLASTLTNYALAKMNSQQVVSKNDYAGLTFTQDVPYLLNVLDELNVACQKANVVKVQDVLDITKDKTYTKEEYANEMVVTPLLNAVEQIVNMANMEALIPFAMNHLAAFLAEKNIDVAFLFVDLTNSELIEDAKLLVAYARDAVKFGVLEYVTTKDIANVNVPLAASMVEGLYGFNMIKKHAPEAMEKLVKMLNDKSKDFKLNLTKDDFETVDFEQELKVLSEVVALFEDLMKAEAYISLKDILDIVNNKAYNSKSFYNDDAVDAMLAMVRKATELKTVELALPDVVDYLVKFADSKDFDISFIKNSEYTNELILEDINTLTYVAKKAYEFGVVDYIFNKDIFDPSADKFNAMLEETINLNILKLFLPDLIALGVNKGLVAAKMDKDITVTRDDFVSVVLADEIHALQDIVVVAKSLMLEKELNSIKDVMDLIKKKGYNNIKFFDVATGTILADFVTELTDLETVKVLLPKFLNYGLGKVKDIDLAFLSEAVTKDELVSDVKTFAKVIVPAINAGVVKVIYKKDFKALPLAFAEYKEILTTVQDMYIINNVWPVLASTLTNYALVKMNSIQFVSEDGFAGLTFAMDVPTLLEALDNIEVLLQKVNATTINDVMDIINNKTYKEASIANKDVATALLDAVQKVIDAKNVQVVLPAMLKHTSEQLTVKGIEVDYLFAIVTNEQIVEDLYTIIDTAREVVEFGMIEFALTDGEIDLNDFSVLNKAIETIINLHVMNGNQPNVVMTVLNGLKVNTENIDLFDVDWKFETQNLQTLLEATRQLLAKFELNTISKIKAFEYKKLITINDSFNELLDIYSEILGCVAKDQIVSEIILPVSEKYLDNNTLKELVALHNIYNTSAEFQSDVLGLQKVVQAIRNLDLNGFLRLGADYPFRDAENIKAIINAVFDLYYLNNENRLSEILNFIDSRVSMDLSEVSVEGIDLRADKDKFIQIYEHFSAITESQYWTMNKKGDKFDIRLLGSTLVIDNMLNMVDLYMDTTIYDKTNFAILFFALPVIKFIAPNYYNALELDKVTISMIENDAQYLENIINTIIELDIVNVVENQTFFTEKVHKAINTILDDLFALEIFKGHGNAFLNELFNDLVNGKTINDVVVPEGTIKFENTSLRQDKEQLDKIINELYAFCANENITTASDFNNFFNNLDVKSFLSKDRNWDMLENIVTTLSNMTFVEENGLALINNIIVPTLEQKGSKLAKYLDLTDYTNDEFMNDINTTKDLISSMKSLGMASILRDEEIAYEKVEDVKAILVGMTELHYMEVHMDQIIDFVSRRLPFSIEALHSNEFTFKEDMLSISDAYAKLVPYLTSSNNQFKTMSDILDFVNGGFQVTKELLISTADYLYDFVDAYDILVNVSALALVAPELVEFIKPRLPERFQGLANVISFDGMSFAEVQNDLAISAELLRNLVDFGISGILDNKDVTFTGSIYSTLLEKEVTRAEMINMMIENVRNMLCLANRSGLLLEVLAFMNVDTTSIDLANVDWDAEFDNLETLVVEGIALLDAYELNTLKEVINYVKSINKSNLKAEIKHLVKLVKSNIENINAITETLDSSEVFNQLFKPLYNKYVLPILPSSLAELGDLSEYTINNLDEDMTRLVAITNALVEMKQVPGTVRDNYASDECIIPTQTIISQFFALNILDQKKQAIVNLVDDLIVEIDLSALDVTNVDLASDGQVFAQYAAEVLVIYKNMKHYRFTTSDLANTEMMTAFIAIYNGCVDTDLIQIIANWAFDKYVSPIAEKRAWVSKFDTTEETVVQMEKELGVILEALLEMGVFSNNGIDFTNQTVTDKLFGIFENVYAFTDQRLVLINMLKENMELIGVVPFTYENVHMKNELKIAKNLLNLVRSFIDNHKNELNTNAIDALNSVTVQNDIDTIIGRLFDSMIAKQLALPIINGMTKIYTIDIYEITIFDGMTVEEFKQAFMSDVYDLIEKARELVSGKKVDYTNVDGIIALLDIVTSREQFASHLEELFKYVAYILGVDIRDEYLADIDWATEYANLKFALQEMSSAMTNVSLSDISTMKNNTFLSALANALPHLNNSELLPRVARQMVEMLVNRMFEDGRLSYYVNRLYNSSYTNELLMKDYALLPEMIKAVVALGYFDDGINYQELDPTLTILDVFFEIEFIKGEETRFFKAITKRFGMIKNYQIDYNLVTDWDAEKVALKNATKELVALAHILDINNMNAEVFNDKAVQDQFVRTIDALSKSIIGQQIVPQLYADKVEPNLGHSDYQGVIDFSNPEFTPDKWASEFEKFFAAYNILQKYNYGSGEMELVNADALELMTILFGTRENKTAGIMSITSNPQLWLTHLYDNEVVPVPSNAKINIDKERDWADEPYRIMDVLTQMENFTTDEGVFSYDVVYECKDEEQLQELLESVNNCEAVRETLLSVVLNTMEKSSEVEEALVNAGLINDEWDDMVQEYVETGSYDTNYWTPERIYDFAKVIAETNANA